MSIHNISAAIGDIASEITDIKTIHTKPVFDLSRKLPAITVLYDGFEQGAFGFVSDEMSRRFVLTIYFSLEGRDLVSLWDRVCNLSDEVTTTFRQHYTLNDTVLKSSIVSGRPIIDVPTTVQAKPKWIGHTFRLNASAEEFV